MCVSVQLNTEPHPTPRHHDAVEPMHDCASELQVAHALVVTFPFALERTALLLGQFHICLSVDLVSQAFVPYESCRVIQNRVVPNEP